MGPSEHDQGIVVQVAKNFEEIDVCLQKLGDLVTAVCRRFGLSEATVSVAIVDDAEICQVNKRFLNRHRPTDCLSFDLSDDKSAANGDSKMRNRKSFELVVNGQMAVREANLRGHSAEAELALYVTHGLLHNLGFEDLTEQEAGKMHQTEDEILQQLGYGLVFGKDGG